MSNSSANRSKASCTLPVASYHCDDQGLVFWPDEPLAYEVRYDLRNTELLAGPTVVACSGTETSPASTVDAADGIAASGRRPVPVSLLAFPTVDRWRLMFRETAILWQDWVTAWEREQADGDGPADAVASVRVLPAE